MAVASFGISVPIVMGASGASDIVIGALSHTATTAATTLVTVPAGRTWTGTIAASCTAATAAGIATAGRALAVFSVAGAGATPAAGTVLTVEAVAAANAATGVAGDSNAAALSCPLVVVAPAGNAVTVQVASTITTGAVHATASGALA